MTAAAPNAARAGEQVLDGKTLADAQLRTGDLDRTLLDGKWIQIDCDHEHVALGAIEAGVEQHLRIFGVEKLQPRDALKRRVLAPDQVHARDHVFDVAFAVPIPDFELYFSEFAYSSEFGRARFSQS